MSYPCCVAMVLALVGADGTPVQPAPDQAQKLFEAVAAGERAQARTLVAKDRRLLRATDAGADVNPADPGENRPLHSAVCGGHMPVVKVLVQAGAKIDARDDEGWQPIHHALWDGREAIVGFLLESGAEVDLFAAAGLGRAGDVWRSIDRPWPGKPQCSRGPHPAYWAARRGQLSLLKRLLAEQSPRPLAREHHVNLLLVAAGAGRTDVVRWLIGRGVDVDGEAVEYSFTRTSETALDGAAFEGHVETAKALLAAGALVEGCRDPKWLGAPFNRYGTTPLLSAIAGGHGEMVALLLDRGADIELGYKDDATPLVYAAEHGKAAIAGLLLARGAKVDGHSETGTPLHAAAKEDRVEVARLLARAGADPDGGEHRKGMSPLHAAVLYGWTDIVPFLLENGADPNVTDGFGGTPLHLAALMGCLSQHYPTRRAAAEGKPRFLEVVRILLEHGADPTRVSDRNPSPLSYAREKLKDPDFLKLLTGGREPPAKEKP